MGSLSDELTWSLYFSQNNELGVNGPSGDFEIREEDRRQGNEVVGRGVETGEEPDLIGNTINTGSSAAQLPQKNILERKEVLIGESLSLHLSLSLF